MARLTSIPLDKTRDEPETDEPMLTWWQGVYDHVFVALHPFVSTGLVGSSVADHEKAGAQMRWSELARDIDSPAFPDFAIALVMASYGVRSEVRQKMGLPVPPDGLVERLHTAIGARGEDYPWDDSISPALEVGLAEAFSRLGTHSLVVWTEFREESSVVSCSTLAAPGTEWRHRLPHPVHVLQDGQARMLVTASFDDLWSLIALTHEAREVAQPETLFEGFWAGPKTSAHWLNHPGSYQPPADWP